MVAGAKDSGVSESREILAERDQIQPWDSDHTALVHVLWEARRKGIGVEDADELASLIMRSKWMKAVRQHAKERV